MATEPHSHIFLGAGHAAAERRTWAVIALCTTMMLVEIVGGLAFGSIALVADGLHMSTHAGAMLLAALAYSYARRHADDPKFSFGTGKLGDLAGFTSAIVLAMIALLIGWESASRLIAPVPIHFTEAIPIAALGLLVNLGSAWLLSGGTAHHHHHGHAHDHGAHDEAREVHTSLGKLALDIFEECVPPMFRLRGLGCRLPDCSSVRIETERPDGTRQFFSFADRGEALESIDQIPEPHAFTAHLHVADETHTLLFEEHAHGDAAAHRDNNMRAAIVHVAADAAVSVLVILGLILARSFGFLWMDPLAGLVGAAVIASWAWGLVRDTGAILLDMTADHGLAARMRQKIEGDGDRLLDLHLWRLGPGHLAAIVSVATRSGTKAGTYRDRLAGFSGVSHLTVEVTEEG